MVKKMMELNPEGWTGVTSQQQHKNPHHKNFGTSLVQWLRIHLPVQGTQVQSLVQEDSTCHRATKLVSPQQLSPHITATEIHPPRVYASQ